jgi:hypothetical protein
LKIRWYWLLLANNVGFMIREYQVISLLNGWQMKVIISYVAIMLTMLMVLWEVWRFSRVRAIAPKTIDQVLDMLILPLNYGMFCSLCVRILVLQDSKENRHMVTAVIDSADIWESWALWSVLELFVLVTEISAKRERADDQEYLATIKAFKTLSVQGVKAFFLILVTFISADILVKGVLGPSFPTLCYWFYKDCMTCEDWYELHINPVAQSIIYIMCSFALIFVFTFERMFSDFLHCIEPYWKFWGVKLVVSVTYFQWLVLNYCLQLPSRETYTLHCFLCCIEMPLLSLLHATCAYPYKKEWLEQLKKLLKESGVDEEDEPVNAIQDEERVDDSGEVPLATHAEGINQEEGASESQSPDVAASASESTSFTISPQRQEKKMQCCSIFIYLLIWIGCCYGATSLIFFVIPPQKDLVQADPLYTFTCSDQDLGHLVEKHSDWHMVLPANGSGQLHIPGTAGAWLPLCGSTAATCALGYTGSPQISCTASGSYTWSGACNLVDCGPPPKYPHAAVDSFQRVWKAGDVVKYKCDKGYKGGVKAICGKLGNYTFQGSCAEIVCGAPPPVHNATPHTQPNATTWKDGVQITYQCDAGYRGKPVATCGDDSVWTLTGSCQILCGTPPIIPHSTDEFDRNESDHIPVGKRLLYKCVEGFGGQPVAICDEKGQYRQEGDCHRVCKVPPHVQHGNAKIDRIPTTGFRIGENVTYWCDAGYGGEPFATCSEDGSWHFQEAADRCTYLGCGSLDQFLTENVSASWQKAMTRSKVLNFTASDYGDAVFFKCNPGYSGSPFATCKHGNWTFTGECMVACGPPPPIDHSTPSFNLTRAQQGWTVGMQVVYKCELGYGGEPIADCTLSGDAGSWTFRGAEKCIDDGCGSLEDYLTKKNKNWREVMEVAERINMTSSDYGDVVFFRCRPGYGGKPLATCSNGTWRMTAACTPFPTSRGCRCKTDWTFCKGSWFGTGCQRWHGCTVRTLDDSYGWCEVQEGSCQQGSTPAWDYCAEGSNDARWAPEYVPNIGPSMRVRLLLVLVLCMILVLLGFCLHRIVKAHRQHQPPINDSTSSFNTTSTRGHSGVSLPHLEEAAPLESANPRGDDSTSSFNVSRRSASLSHPAETSPALMASETAESASPDREQLAETP